MVKKNRLPYKDIHTRHHKKAGKNLAFVFFMNLTFNIIVIIGGLATKSMAILSDCIHDVSDTISIGLAWVLEKISQKNPSKNYSYGYERFSILGAVIISVFVIFMGFVILSEAIPRIFSPEGVDSSGMLIVAVVGIIFKSVSVYRLHKGETFNEKAILLHQLGDIFEWIAILILSLVLIFWKGSPNLDPYVSIGIAIWLIFNLGRNLHKSLEVLLQKVPDSFNSEEFYRQIMGLDGVRDIEDYHIWSLDGIDTIMTLKVNVDLKKDTFLIKKEITEISKQYNVVDITIEFT